MEFPPVSNAEMQAARVLSGATMALWLGVGVVPALRPYAARIRLLVLGAYLVGIVLFIGWLFIR